MSRPTEPEKLFCALDSESDAEIGERCHSLLVLSPSVHIVAQALQTRVGH